MLFPGKELKEKRPKNERKKKWNEGFWRSRKKVLFPFSSEKKIILAEAAEAYVKSQQAYLQHHAMAQVFEDQHRKVGQFRIFFLCK